MFSSTETTSATASDDVFKRGKYETGHESVEAKGRCFKPTMDPAPQKPLIVYYPTEAREYPVMILLHGYMLSNTFYSQLINHVASHGFIVVAPQLYTIAGCDATEEIQLAGAIADWLPDGLPVVLPTNVRPNLAKIALSGHSRGGKVAFALALGLASTTTTKLPFSVLIGIDPVDGTSAKKQTNPPVLTFKEHSFDLNMPVMVIGSGLGDVSAGLLFPACAPAGVNHEEFYKECKKPVCYLVAKDYGHMDMLDDKTNGGPQGWMSYCMCKNGNSREPMRTFVGGMVVAFLRAFLEDDDTDLMAVKNTPEIVPLKLQRIEYDLS